MDKNEDDRDETHVSTLDQSMRIYATALVRMAIMSGGELIIPPMPEVDGAGYKLYHRVHEGGAIELIAVPQVTN